LSHYFTRDERTGSWVNAIDRYRVTGAQQSEFGDVRLDLSGGHALVVFPAGSEGEAWRLFVPGSDADHLVFPAPTENKLTAINSRAAVSFAPHLKTNQLCDRRSERW
jgi:hypothetical protein